MYKGRSAMPCRLKGYRCLENVFQHFCFELNGVQSFAMLASIMIVVVSFLTGTFNFTPTKVCLAS